MMKLPPPLQEAIVAGVHAALQATQVAEREWQNHILQELEGIHATLQSILDHSSNQAEDEDEDEDAETAL